MKLLTVIFILFTTLYIFVKGTVDAGITTRAVEATGVFYCGNTPLEGVKVALKRENTDDIDDIIGKAATGRDGKFRISGNTERFGGSKSTIDPVLNIYHKCDKDQGKPYEKFTLRFPRTYATMGTIARRQYDAGKINLQIKYPDQKEEKNPPI